MKLNKGLLNGSVCAVLLSLTASAQAGRIAWSSARPDNVGAGREIYVMNEDGTDAHRVTNTSPTTPAGVPNLTASASEPTFSPDGTKIAFVDSSPDSTNSDIYVINADGTNRMQLTNTPDSETHPSWNSDGTRLVFARDAAVSGTGSLVDNAASDIYVMDANGSNVTKIADVADDMAPSWSPDGSRIAFSSFVNDGSVGLIYTVRPDGTQLTALTTSGFSTQPSWSPNSQQVVFSFYDTNSGYYQIALIGAQSAGGTPVILTDATSQGAFFPVFKSDGSGVIFTASPFDDPELYSIDLNGANLKRLTDNPGFDGYPSVTAAVVVVPPTNQAPVALSQSIALDANTSIPVTLSATDAENNTLTYILVSGPSHGTLIGTPPNLTYTPNANFSGQDSFVFKVNDGTSDSNLATIVLNVRAVVVVPPTPTPTPTPIPTPTPTPTPFPTLHANDDFFTYNANPRNHSTRLGVLIVPAPGVLANDQVDRSQAVRFALVNKPKGKGFYLAMRPDGSFTFITGKRGAHTFTFTYRILNGGKLSNLATVTLTAATR
jgi:Tol biopolymer transport system component